MTDLIVFAQPGAPNERIVAGAELAELRRSRRVIDGEFYIPRPIWPALTASGVLLAFGVAELVLEVAR